MLSNDGPGRHPVAQETCNDEDAGWRLGEITGTGKARELIEDPDEQRAIAVMQQMRTRGAPLISPLLKCQFAQAGLSAPNRHQDGTTVMGCGDQDHHGVVGIDEEHKYQSTGSHLSRGSSSDQQPHQDAEIVPGDMDQIALVDIFASAQPSPAHAAAVEIMGEGSLDDFGPPPHRLLTNP